ncbi:BnaC01g21040D [Brassica napus]|uniref:BnaC01g21040D protein n=1 Tax=Brassica napus TaxID=3708 RepID=A0A078HCR2_BRANA|nr:BnaC01g21040D [Brassica napus]
MDGDMGTYFESILELDQITPDYMYGLNFSVEFSAKQRYDSYVSGTLDYMYGLDLSNNELSGEIPEEVGDLVRARSLNLSHNFLAGSILETFSKMKDIESLDLSFNKLYGPIPFPLTDDETHMDPWRDIFHGSGWNLCVYVL